MGMAGYPETSMNRKTRRMNESKGARKWARRVKASAAAYAAHPTYIPTAGFAALPLIAHDDAPCSILGSRV